MGWEFGVRNPGERGRAISTDPEFIRLRSDQPLSISRRGSDLHDSRRGCRGDDHFDYVAVRDHDRNVHLHAQGRFLSCQCQIAAGHLRPTQEPVFLYGTAKIQVFSPESGTWQTPITLPGIANTSQLIGIAESPDGSMLAVADNGGQAIYVLHPDNPGSAVRYPVPSPANGSYPSPPVSLAVLDHKSIFFVAVDILNQVAGSASFHKLDLTTGQFTDFQIGSVGTAELNGGRVLLSPDQSTVFVNIAGSVYWIDTATDTINPDSAISQGFQTADGAISTDGSTISINGYLTDGSLQVENVTAYVDWETWLPTATYGQKLNQDGSILYQPLTNGVDLIERNTGRLLYRVQVPGI